MVAVATRQSARRVVSGGARGTALDQGLLRWFLPTGPTNLRTSSSLPSVSQSAPRW
jgi:hypothetical protein